MAGKVWASMRQLYNSKVQVRLTIYFLLILLPLVGVSLFANFRSATILEGQISERTKGSLQSSLDYIDLLLEDLNKLSILITTDYSIKPVLHEANSILLPTHIFGFYNVLDRLANIREIHGFLQEISILHISSGILISSEYGARKIDAEQYPWFSNAIQASGKPVVYLGNTEKDALFGQNTVSFMRPMDVNGQEHQANILILTIAREKLEGLIRAVLPTSNSAVYLYASDGKLIAGAGQTGELPDNIQELADNSSQRDAELLTWHTPSKKSDWSLMLVQPKKELYKQSIYVQNFIYAIIVLSVVLAVLISIIVFKGIATPLAKLLYGMKQIRLGNLNTRLPSTSQDQFGTLTDSFNQMVAEQQMLIHDVYEHQLQLSHTELKFLQSQINPHFLYNTLDSIYWTAKNYDAEEISEMVLNLSKFFRLSLSKGRESFTVTETIEHLQYYLRVQQFRLLGQLEVEFHIGENTKQLYVLKLLLQPVVENAILHGLEKKGGCGLLIIKSEQKDQMLQISVKDDGAGVSKERLDYIKSQLEQLNHAEFTPTIHGKQIKELFGLRNVIGRMKLYYGAQAELHMESVENEGTKVTLRIPLEMVEKQLL